MGNSSVNNSHPKDTIILHQFPRGFKAPSGSPFALKLETWIRMAKLDYKNEFGLKFSPKGKIPWIHLNGQIYADSQFCIDFLASKYDKDFSKNLNPSERAIERAFIKLAEESLFWCMALHRFKFDPKTEESGIPKVFLIFFGRKLTNRAKAQGYGLHSKEEVYAIGKTDLKSINDFIDNKKFLFGNEVCNADASLFGLLCQFIYHEKGPCHHFIMDKCPNIVRYVSTMRETYWPDWNQHITYKP